MDLGELLDPGAITLKVDASSKRQALSIVAEIAARTLEMPAAEITAKLMARERLGSTGVCHGVAVPHARLKGLHLVVAPARRLSGTHPPVRQRSG